MADNNRAPIDSEPIASDPCLAIVTALVTEVVAFFCYRILGQETLPLILIGLLASGIAVSIRPRSWLILALAAASGVFARLAMTPQWDSARALVGVLSIVAAAAAVLAILPRGLRRVAVSLLVLLHLSGICVAVTMANGCALSKCLWFYFYRPHLEYLYLDRSYNYYSPDPGPTSLLWFYVRYEDGSGKWIKVPSREDHVAELEYERMRTMAHKVNWPVAMGDVPGEVMQRRTVAVYSLGIPFHPDGSASLQYREPVPFCKLHLESYARYAARTASEESGKTVTGVKVYSVVHHTLSPKQVLDQPSPAHPTLFVPYS